MKNNKSNQRDDNVQDYSKSKKQNNKQVENDFNEKNYGKIIQNYSSKRKLICF